MEIQRPWAFWRRVQYGVGFLMLLTLICVGAYYQYFYALPTCTDGLKNGTETGIDCGGSCARICTADILPPAVLWSESFKIIDGQYNAVAYIENRNKGVGTPELHYTFTLEDDAGVIVEQAGTTVLPPDSVYPVFEGRIQTGDRIPTKTSIRFTNEPSWLPSETGRGQFELRRRELSNADSLPRLTAELYNSDLDEARDVEVIATIFDKSGKPLTASRTFVEYFDGRATKNIVFTWPEPIAKTLRSCEIPTDVALAIDLSGSMDDDGGTPPEPITSVLAAAQSFVSRLKEHDQVSLVTYATDASITETLTREISRVATVVQGLAISPKEQRGSTNTGEALKRMREALNSEKHNTDARKVAVLLTDGLATAPLKDPEVFAEGEARLLKESGVELFTVGLGAKVNEVFLKNLASSERQYYKAPSTNDLASIYELISKSICEDGAAVIEIVPKTETSFTQF